MAVHGKLSYRTCTKAWREDLPLFLSYYLRKLKFQEVRHLVSWFLGRQQQKLGGQGQVKADGVWGVAKIW